jgi:excisionase family DNA binding protein
MSVAKVSYTLDEAAATTGVSVRTLRRAQAEGALRFHYVTAKPVILHGDLIAWIEAAPIESPTKR